MIRECYGIEEGFVYLTSRRSRISYYEKLIILLTPYIQEAI
jgi:hypothetical protein